MESTFGVFLTGEILPGYERGDAVSQLAMFSSDLAVAIAGERTKTAGQGRLQ